MKVVAKIDRIKLRVAQKLLIACVGCKIVAKRFLGLGKLFFVCIAYCYDSCSVGKNRFYTVRGLGISKKANADLFHVLPPFYFLCVPSFSSRVSNEMRFCSAKFGLFFPSGDDVPRYSVKPNSR